MSNYRDVLLGIVQELESHKAILVKDWYIGEGLDEDNIQQIEAQYGTKLDDSLKRFYGQVNGAIIEWELRPQQNDVAIQYRREGHPDPIYGLINLLRLGEVLPEWDELQNSVWDDRMSDDEAKEDLKAFRPFDDNVEEAFIGFLVEKGVLEDELYFLLQGQDICSVDSNVEGYLKALAQSRGFYWWQESYTLRPAGFGNDDMFFYISQLFPDETFSTFG